MKNKTLLTLCAAPLLLSVNAIAQGAFSIVECNFFDCLSIEENYNGEYAFTGWGQGEQREIRGATYNRQFTANTPATIVLPFSVPAAGTTNAKFYTLQYVIPDFREEGKRTWLAKMKYIGDENKPQAHVPYAVIVPTNGTITFNFKNASSYVSAPYTGENNTLNNKKVPNVAYDNDENELGLSYTVTDNKDQWYFIGNYSNGTYSSGDAELGLCYGFEGSNDGVEPKGTFGKIANGTKKNAFRGLLCKAGDNVHLPASYIKQNGAAKSANVFSIPETINVEFVDTDANGKEHTTYVGKLNRIDNVRLNRERSTFDLKGRNVDGKRTAKGVYLKK